MPIKVTMRWPNGGSANSATTGGSNSTTSQKAPSARMSGAPARRFTEQALRAHRQEQQHSDIESCRRPGIAQSRRNKGLERADTQRAQQCTRDAAPAAQGNGDIGLEHVSGALRRHDQELVTQQESGHARQRPGERE